MCCISACMCATHLPVCVPLLEQPHKGERRFLCVVFFSFLAVHQCSDVFVGSCSLLAHVITPMNRHP